MPVAALAARRVVDELSRHTSFKVPHSGHRSGASLRTSGCIGQAYAIGATSVASSFIPHLGQPCRPVSPITSGCIGHVWATVAPGELRLAYIHLLGDERERLVRLGVERRGNPVALRHHVAAPSAARRTLLPVTAAVAVADADRRQRVGRRRSAVLEHSTGPVEQHVYNDPLGRSNNDAVDELLPLIPAAVAADALHPGACHADVEDACSPCWSGESAPLAQLRREREVRLAADEQDAPNPPHRGEGRLERLKERPDRPRAGCRRV